MTSTASAAEFLPAEHPHDERLAAELRHVTSGSRRHGRYQLRVDAVSLEIRRGEVTTPAEPARQVGGLAAGPARRPGVGQLGVGAASADERGRLRVQPGYGIYPKLTVRQNLVVAQRRSGRAADLEWIDQVAEALGLSGMLGYRVAPRRRRPPRAVGGRPSHGGAARRSSWSTTSPPASSVADEPDLMAAPHGSRPARLGRRRTSPPATRSPRRPPTGSSCSTAAGSSTTPPPALTATRAYCHDSSRTPVRRWPGGRAPPGEGCRARGPGARGRRRVRGP